MPETFMKNLKLEVANFKIIYFTNTGRYYSEGFMTVKGLLTLTKIWLEIERRLRSNEERPNFHAYTRSVFHVLVVHLDDTTSKPYIITNIATQVEI